ncbi:MAG: hypothetical protein HDS64_04630 [Bacteroidales bacterium]|nr:hypothetical protein [Bacteroidales bacterium]MBD5353010.1 hypothetical protein [Bacteroides sp.]MBD5373514.1 hypothetical protein [Bacteroides sp.]
MLERLFWGKSLRALFGRGAFSDAGRSLRSLNSFAGRLFRRGLFLAGPLTAFAEQFCGAPFLAGLFSGGGWWVWIIFCNFAMELTFNDNGTRERYLVIDGEWRAI